MFKRVEIKLIAPNKEETPAKCNEKMAKSTEGPECDWILAKGGYTVHPVFQYSYFPTKFKTLNGISSFNPFILKFFFFQYAVQGTAKIFTFHLNN